MASKVGRPNVYDRRSQSILKYYVEHERKELINQYCTENNTTKQAIVEEALQLFFKQKGVEF